MAHHFDRAVVLYNQARYAQAEQELRLALAEHPHDAKALGLLAESLSQLKRHKEAVQIAQQAIHCAPDLPYAHYALASVLHRRKQLPAAKRAIQQAIQLNPHRAAFFSRLAAIQFDQCCWRAALASAEQGLQLDPEHSGCLNLRTMALAELNRVAEASEAVQLALQCDPEDAIAHTNQGWLLLEQSRYLEARQVFREALRLNPKLRWAREGMMKALKARNPLYRLLHTIITRYVRQLFLPGHYGAKVGAFVTFGFVPLVLLFLLQSRLQANSILFLATLTIATSFLLIVFVLPSLFAGIIDPLFTLLLRLDCQGRLVVSHEYLGCSKLVGGLVMALLGQVGVWWLERGGATFMLAGLVCLSLGTPIGLAIVRPELWSRWVKIGYAIGLATLGMLGFTFVLSQQDFGLSNTLALGVFALALACAGFAAPPVNKTPSNHQTPSGSSGPSLD